jgi:hypothetical protein
MERLTADEVAVGVFTSALNLRERALSVQNTWLKGFTNGYLIGGWYDDPGLKMISLGETVGEDYRSAHRKQFLGLLELRHRVPDAKWFFMTGCDAFIFKDNLVALLDRYDPSMELLVGGHCGMVTVDGEALLYPAGGPGFAVSKALVDALVPAIPGFVGQWEEANPGLATACDAAMAYLAKHERGVGLSYEEGFYYGPPYYYPANTYKDGEGRDVNRPVIDRPIAFHNLSIREMYLLDGSRWPRRPGIAGKAFDKATRVITRRLKSRSIMNSVCRLLFAHAGATARPANSNQSAEPVE